MNRGKQIKIKQDEQPEEIQGKFSRLQFKSNEEYFDDKNLEKELFLTKKYRKLNKIEAIYDRNMKKITFNLGEQDSDDEEQVSVHLKRKSTCSYSFINPEDISAVTKVAHYLDHLLKNWKNQQNGKKNIKEVNFEDDNPVETEENEKEIDFGSEKQEKIKDFLDINKK